MSHVSTRQHIPFCAQPAYHFLQMAREYPQASSRETHNSVPMTPLYRRGKSTHHGFTKRHLDADNSSNLDFTFRSGTTCFQLHSFKTIATQTSPRIREYRH
ncbi:hypothetical protein BDF21DRAFT_397593 [Thamnidium elegans]|nr:hypothetical protein BDF21DRAFT_397593 [Thamnidium elegans]